MNFRRGLVKHFNITVLRAYNRRFADFAGVAPINVPAVVNVGLGNDFVVSVGKQADGGVGGAFNVFGSLNRGGAK